VLKSVVVVTALAACSGSHQKPAEPAGRIEKLAIGSLEAYALADGHFDVPNDGKTFGLDKPTTDVDAVLAAAGLPKDSMRLDLQCLLVKADGKVLLFDTGMGAFSENAETGQLPKSLALAGVSATAVTDIFISHSHGDHVGGLMTKAGALAFPAATIHLSAPEWATLQADPDKDSKRLVAVITPKVATFEPGAQLMPMVKAVDTRGHTPGHSSYEIGDGTDKLFYLGDLAHHFVISVQRPDWQMSFDHDHEAGQRMRQQTLKDLGASGTRVFAGHFPFPGVGRIVAAGDGLAWKAD
jgi:glyoxylase-like metal-dependent hydrolase (beta-lactamase superfamily II)